MAVVVIGGTAGLGLELARHYAGQGRDVVLTGRSVARSAEVAASIGPKVQGIAVDLAEPSAIGGALASIGPVDHLILAAINRDTNSLADYDSAAAIKLATLKLVGYVETVRHLAPRLTVDGSVLLFGGMARLRPYPGSTTVTAVNAGVIGMVRTLSLELAPIRVNSIHPGIVGDSPYWMDKPAELLEAVRASTLTGRLVTMAEIVQASVFLLECPAVNGVDLTVDGGWQ